MFEHADAERLLEYFIDGLLDGSLNEDEYQKFVHLSYLLSDSQSQLSKRIKKKLKSTLDICKENVSRDFLYLCSFFLVCKLLGKNPEKFFFRWYSKINVIKNIHYVIPLFTRYYQESNICILVKKMCKTLYGKEFWQDSAIRQQYNIYKSFYMLNQMYQRGEYSINLYTRLKKVFFQALKKQQDNVIFYLYTPLQFSWNGVATTQEELKLFNEEIEKPLEKYIKYNIFYRLKLHQNLRSVGANKIKVCFLQERIIDYSIYKVFYSLMEAISKEKEKFEKYEFIIYDLSYMELGGSESHLVEDIEKIGFKYINMHQMVYSLDKSPFYSILEKAVRIREQLISEHIDVLIGMHSRPEYNFLFTTRTCPRQVYWSHGNYEYNIEGIDFKIKHGDFGVERLQIRGFDYLQFSDIVSKKFLDPYIDATMIEAERAKYPSDVTILGTVGRLSKVNSDGYIKVINNILRNNKNVIYIAAGSGDYYSIISLIDENVRHQWYFVGHVNPHLYGHIINIWPNTFPHTQGLSTLEFMAKGKPVVTLKNEHHNYDAQLEAERLYYAKLSYPLVCLTVEEYEDAVQHLISDTLCLKKDGEIFKSYVEQCYYSGNPAESFYNVLEKVIV